MNETKIKNIKKFLLRKRILIPLALVLVIGGFIISSDGSGTTVSVITPTQGDLASTVRATGQVTSNTDLSLAFNKSGVIKSIRAVVGKKVVAGEVLATLSQQSELASVTQARGSLAAAEARLSRTREGATSEEVALAKVSLANAELDLQNVKVAQQTLVENANLNLLNSTLEAIPEGNSTDYSAPTISGNYVGGRDGTIKIITYYSGSPSFTASGLVSGSGIISTSPQAIGNSGLYIKFPSTSNATVTTWLIEIPNKKATNYNTNYNAYQSALKTESSAISQAQSLVDQRKAELAIKQAQARPSDVNLGEADVLQAQGGLQAALARYEDTVIRAPASGTVTKVDIKYGELSDPKTEAIVIQDVSRLYIESNINESNIAQLKLGQIVVITFDALGPDQKFTGTIAQIDPSSETVDGIVNYKIKVSINESNVAVRPGMNAEITINIESKQNVLSVPKAAITVTDGKSYVNVITNEKRKKYEKRGVTVSGFVGDGNLSEITSGISLDEKIALISPK